SSYSATFTITAPDAVVVTEATDNTSSACIYADQSAADDAFAAWLATASVSGGCSPTSTPSTTTGPAYCGGSVTVTWTIEDHCYAGSSYSATFTITAPDAVVVTEATDNTSSSCIYADQDAADAAFADWLNTASVSGGCSPTSTPSTTTVPAYCGVSVTV